VTEEQVTKSILSLLVETDWNIIMYDFPQSGSGRMLHQNDKKSEKNKGGLVPDIIAVKNGICLFFENKDRVVISDFIKISELINNCQYSSAISKVLEKHEILKIYYGVGFPSVKWGKRAEDNASLVDFIVGVSLDKKAMFLYNPYTIEIV